MQSFSCLNQICDWISKAEKGPIKLSCMNGAISNKQKPFLFYHIKQKEKLYTVMVCFDGVF